MMLTVQTWGNNGLSSLVLTMPAIKNGEKSKSEYPLMDSHCWYIQDIYLKVCVFIIIWHEEPHRTWKQFIIVCFDSASHWKKVNNVTQTISVAAIIGFEAIIDFDTLLNSKLLVTNLSRFPTIVNIYFEVNTVN